MGLRGNPAEGTTIFVGAQGVYFSGEYVLFHGANINHTTMDVDFYFVLRQIFRLALEVGERIKFDSARKTCVFCEVLGDKFNFYRVCLPFSSVSQCNVC